MSEQSRGGAAPPAMMSLRDLCIARLGQLLTTMPVTVVTPPASGQQLMPSCAAHDARRQLPELPRELADGLLAWLATHNRLGACHPAVYLGAHLSVCDLRTCRAWPSDFFVHLAARCVNLSALRLPAGATDADIAALATRLGRCVGCDRYRGAPVGHADGTRASLVELDLSQCTQLSAQSLAFVASRLQSDQLRILRLAGLRAEQTLCVAAGGASISAPPQRWLNRAASRAVARRQTARAFRNGGSRPGGTPTGRHTAQRRLSGTHSLAIRINSTGCAAVRPACRCSP